MNQLPLDDALQPVGWMVTVQDFTGFVRGTTGKRLPPVVSTWFATRDEAVSRKAYLRTLYPSPSCLICVTPARQKRAKPKVIPKPSHHGSMDWS